MNPSLAIAVATAALVLSARVIIKRTGGKVFWALVGIGLAAHWVYDGAIMGHRQNLVAYLVAWLAAVAWVWLTQAPTPRPR